MLANFDMSLWSFLEPGYGPSYCDNEMRARDS